MKETTDFIPTDYPFMKFPRALYKNSAFSNLSIESKTFLAMIFDRYNVSLINSDKFTDENGRIYIIYTLEEISRNLNCSNTRAMRIIKELESNNMITRKRKNRLSPYRIYITNKFYDNLNCEVTTSQNNNSRVYNSTSHDFTKCEDNKNNNINNNRSNNNSSVFRFERSEDEIKEQIEYDCIVCESNKKLLDEIVMIIFDVLNGTSPTVKIGKDDMPRSIVISRFCKLDSEHIDYVLSLIKTNTISIKHMKSYLVTTLYNTPATMESAITAEFAYNQSK